MNKVTLLIVTLLLNLPLIAQINEEELKTEAQEFFENGEFLKAHPLYSQLVSLHPRSQEYNFRFGASTIFNGSDYETAIKHLKFATHKTGVDARAHYYLGLAYQLNYNFGDAVQSFNNFKNMADSKVLGSFDVDRRLEQSRNGQGLLSEIKDIVVLEKTSSRSEDFFRFFNLDAMGGRLLAMPEELKTKEDKKRGGDALIYYPGSTAEIYFSSYGKDGKTGKDIYRAYILPDGSFSDPEILKGGVNTPHDEDYAFMHPDGKTLYFCSKGHNSMGGYDIFRSIYNSSSNSFSRPENMDFAINTPDDDIFFVSDSSNTTACFASGRSSQMGELTVYKVKVKGIPVQVVFLQGEFLSDFDSSRKSKITVKDEMTGRPVETTFSSTQSGEYVISLPKSGTYLFEVEAENSTVIHEGIVQVPSFNEPVVLKQKLKIENQGGQEKLVITNYFEEPLTDRIAEFTSRLMRQKAGLEVNATPELLAQLEDESNLTVERTVETAPMLAGFSDGTTVESLADELRDNATADFGKSEKLKSNAEKAYNLAQNEFQEAERLLVEATTLKSAYDGSKNEDAINKLRESQRKAALAKRKLNNARNAISIADSTLEYAQQLKFQSEKQLKKAGKLEEAADAENMELLMLVLEEEKRNRDAKELITQNPAQNALSQAELISRETEDILRNINRLRAEKSDVQNSIKLAERQKESAKKKELDEINSRISTLQQEGEDLELRIERENQRLADVETQKLDYQSQAEIYDTYIASDTQNAALQTVKLSADQKQQLLGNIDKSRVLVDDITVTDDETLALIGEETIITRNDLTSIYTLPPAQENSNVELKPVKEIKTDFESSMSLLLPQSTQKDKAYKMNLIKARALESLDAKEKKVQQSKQSGELSQEEYDSELTEIREARMEIRSVELPLYKAPEKDLSNEEKLEVLSQITDNAETISTSGIDWKDNLQVLTLSQNAAEKAKEELAKNNQKILETENDAVTKSLLKENEAIQSFLKEIPDFSGLSEVDRQQREHIANLGAGEKSLTERIQKQKESTLDYLEQLDDYQLALEQGRSAENQAKDEQYLKVINQLNSFKESAQLRLSGLNSDMETAMDDESVAANSTEVKSPSNESQNQNTSNEQSTAETADISNSANDRNDSSTKNQTTELPENANEQVATQEAAENVTNETKADPVVALSPEVKLPNERKSMILTLMPEYPLEGTEAAKSIDSVQERIETEKSFIKILEENIKTRETFLVTNNSPEEKSRVDVELKQLRSLKRQSELSIMDWNNQLDSEEEDVLAANLGVGNALSDEDKAVFDFIAAPAEKEDPKNIYESDAINSLKAANTNPSYDILNADKIEELRTEIVDLESEIQSEENPKKQKKLDRKIENAYTQIASMEIGNATKLKGMAEVQYEENRELVDELYDQKEDKVNASRYLSDRVEEYTEEADDQMNEARTIRKNATRINDPIEKNYRLREAFALEAAALENQEKAIAILENADQLAGKEEVYLASLEAGEKAASNENAIAEANELRRAQAEAAAASETPISEDNSQTQDTALENLSETEKIASNTVTDSQPKTVKLNRETAENSPEEIIGAQEINRFEAMSNEDLLSGIELTEEEKAEKRRSEAFIRYNELMKEAESKKLKLVEKATEKRDVLEKIEVLEDRIAKLEASLENESDEAVKEGIKEEIRRLRSQAQVNYGRLELMEDELNSEKTLLGNVLDEAMVVAEGIRNEAPLALKPSEISIASSEARPEMGEVGEYLFSAPGELTADLFAVYDDAPYSSGNPIPMNIAMPKGVVFKVQVGAFKNEIPQDLFGGFAPMSGETLNSGITRYTVGMFRQFPGANAAKSEIQGMGYPDAFVVAFIDGRRVPLYEALAELGQDAIAVASDAGVNNSATTNPNSSTLNSENSTKSENLSNQSVGNDFNPSVEDVDYYTEAEDAAPANQVESLKGLFYTVQVGVYSNPVTSADLKFIEPLNSESTTGGRVRYTTGVYNNITEAAQRKENIRSIGIEDAFVTAYYNGTRVTMQKAADLYEELGPGVYNVTNALSDSYAVNEWEFEVVIGRFEGEVPGNVAKAMLFLEESRGIVQNQDGDAIEYSTGRVNSLSSAKLIQKEFERYDVNTTEIRAFENGVQKDLSIYKGE